jgi:hypothetical protein
VIVEWLGKASPAMNEVLPGRATKCICVSAKAPAPIRVSCESVSNEIDEGDLQPEKHDEQRI